MAENIDDQSLQNISVDINEYQNNVICSMQCIRAQAFLAAKLRKEAKNRKETIFFMSSANLNLQCEITQAQANIQSLLSAQDSIKMANVELQKEWLLAKDQKVELMERVKNGEKKYEDLWLESKARYESVPFVQKLLKVKNEVQNLEQQLTKLENNEKALIEEIEIKTEICRNLGKKRIIELAGFIVNEMPKIINVINEKTVAIKNLTTELNNLDLQTQAKIETKKITQQKQNIDDLKAEKVWPIAETIDDSNLIMPKLQLGNLDFDVLTDNLDQVKIKRVDTINKTLEKDNINSLRAVAAKVNRKIENVEKCISSFFNKPSVYEEIKTKKYADMKLINILENVKIDTNEFEHLMAKVNPNTLYRVDSISGEDNNSVVTGEVLKNKDKRLESETIEEIDLTSSDVENILPPTQFLDMTSKNQGPQRAQQEEVLNQPLISVEKSNLSQAHKEEKGKKTVSFDLPNTLEINANDTNKSEVTDAVDANVTLTSQLDVSAEGFAKMKDMIMKKHNLDLSPQFVYAKNIITPLNLQKSEDAVVTSKFFQHNQNDLIEQENADRVALDNENAMGVNKIPIEQNEKENIFESQSKNDKHPSFTIDFDTDIVSSPKRQKMNEFTQADKPVSGFLFSHGAQMIPESLDVSMNTMGFEDGDTDFPHCIDSSLLLSPKADVPMTGENREILSQDGPNFLSGLRKTGLSIFVPIPSSESKADSSAQNQNQEGSGFSFNFGGEEKKRRGGLFSMFQ